MSNLNESEKLAFAEWMLGTLRANADTIARAKEGVSFDVEGNINLLAGRNASAMEAEGTLARLEAEKRMQTAIKNEAVSNFYNSASELADAIVGHIGKSHKLSKIIRNKRDSMNRETNGVEPGTPQAE